MTDPLKSKYDSLPAWSPTIYSGSKGKEDEEKAAAKYAETYGGSTTYVDGDAPEAEAPVADTKTPTVSAAYTTAPNLVPVKPGDDGDSKPPEMASANPFSIQLGVLMSSEQTCLNATNAVATGPGGYTDLRAKVTAAANSDTIFGQRVGTPGY